MVLALVDDSVWLLGITSGVDAARGYRAAVGRHHDREVHLTEESDHPPADR